MEEHQVIVVGGGPAAYSAAIYLARATLKPLVLAGEAAGGQLMLTTEIENYPGFDDGIQGPELMDKMRKQAEKFGAEIKNVNVTRMDLGGEIKKVYVGETEYSARAVILCLGAQAKMLKVGEESLIGRGVSTCAVCDAAFYKNKKVYVVGGGDAAMEDVLALKKFSQEVTLIHRRGELKASKIMQSRVVDQEKIPVMWNSEVIGVIGQEKLTAIKVKDLKTGEEKELPADGLFLAIGHTPVTDILKNEVELDGHGYLITNLTRAQSQSNQEVWLNSYPTETNIKGVFGAGDMVDIRYRQAITAAGMGCQAALDAEKFLTGNLASW